MDILWDPEIGNCTECNRTANVVRRFTSDGTHRMLCIDCWNEYQDELPIGDAEWVANHCILLEYDGAPQAVISH